MHLVGSSDCYLLIFKGIVKYSQFKILDVPIKNASKCTKLIQIQYTLTDHQHCYQQLHCSV